MDIEGGFDQNDSRGFIAINAIRLKAHHVIMRWRGKKVTGFLKNGMSARSGTSGRRAGGPLRALDRFNASIGQDLFLAEAEIAASAAYARACSARRTSTEGEARRSKADCDGRRQDRGGRGPDRFEDVHSAVELLLTEEIGPAG